jgi:hypothetical protein
MQSGLEPTLQGAPGVWPGAAVLVGPGGIVRVEAGPEVVGPVAVDDGAVEVVDELDVVEASVVVLALPSSSSELHAAATGPATRASTTTRREIR